MTDIYNLVCMQAASKWTGDVRNARAIIKENTVRHLQMLDMLPYGAAPLGEYPKIVVYPEFSLQGIPCMSWEGDNAFRWLEGVSEEIPGVTTDEFARKSVEKDCYQQAVLWERDPSLGDDVFFESAFITDPKGKVALVRRRLIVGMPGVTTTCDVYDEYVKKYGPDPVDALFPVLETPYGVLGPIICCEMSTPEIARALVLNGAEVLLHSTSEPHPHNNTLIQQKHFRDMQRPVRASDNTVYLASCNIGRTISDASVPEFRDRGCSEILDWHGNRLARIDGPGEAIATAPIDIDALRRARMKSLFGGLRTEVFAPVFLTRTVWPLNRKVRDQRQRAELVAEVQRSLLARKAMRPP